MSMPYILYEVIASAKIINNTITVLSSSCTYNALGRKGWHSSKQAICAPPFVNAASFGLMITDDIHKQSVNKCCLKSNLAGFISSN